MPERLIARTLHFSHLVRNWTATEYASAAANQLAGPRLFCTGCERVIALDGAVTDAGAAECGRAPW